MAPDLIRFLEESAKELIGSAEEQDIQTASASLAEAGELLNLAARIARRRALAERKEAA